MDSALSSRFLFRERVEGIKDVKELREMGLAFKEHASSNSSFFSRIIIMAVSPRTCAMHLAFINSSASHTTPGSGDSCCPSLAEEETEAQRG